MGDSARKRPDRLAVVKDGEGTRRIIDEGTGQVQSRQPPPGRSIEDLTEDGEQRDLFVMPIIAGSQGRLNGNVGGRQVTSSELKFKGGPLTMTGQFPEGARVRVVMEFEVTDVDFKLVRNAGIVVGKKRLHQGELVGYAQVEAVGPLLQDADSSDIPE